MAVKKIRYTTNFERAYKKLSPKDKLLAERREILFRQNPFDTKLRTHKLKGKLKKFWSFSITQSHRIMFRFSDDETVIFYDIGSHKIYQ